MTDSINEIKNALKKNLLIIGQDRVSKMIKNKTLSKVFMASNSSEAMKTEVSRFADSASIPLEVLDLPNDELSVLCKKQFLISVLGIKK